MTLCNSVRVGLSPDPTGGGLSVSFGDCGDKPQQSALTDWNSKGIQQELCWRGSQGGPEKAEDGSKMPEWGAYTVPQMSPSGQETVEKAKL